MFFQCAQYLLPCPHYRGVRQPDVLAPPDATSRVHTPASVSAMWPPFHGGPTRIVLTLDSSVSLSSFLVVTGQDHHQQPTNPCAGDMTRRGLSTGVSQYGLKDALAGLVYDAVGSLAICARRGGVSFWIGRIGSGCSWTVGFL